VTKAAFAPQPAAFEAAACSRQWRAGGIGKPRGPRGARSGAFFAKIAKVTYKYSVMIQKRRAVSLIFSSVQFSSLIVRGVHYTE
jgi:hypothetical protein